MWAAVNEVTGSSASRTPLGRAQALVYQAFGRADPAERVRMARQALEICPDCADAHVLLAEHAAERRRGAGALSTRRRRRRAGAGPGDVPARKPDISGASSRRGRTCAPAKGWPTRCGRPARGDQAIDHLREMLRLNPSDNQGLRLPWSPGS